MLLIQSPDFISFQKVKHKSHIAHVFHMVTCVTLKGLERAAVFLMRGIKEVFIGDTRRFRKAVKRSGSAFIKVCHPDA